MLAISAIVLVVLSLLVRAAHSGHRRVPEPDGLVCRITVREALTPLDRFEVHPMPGPEPRFAVFTLETLGSHTYEATFTLHRYPDGDVLERLHGAAAVAARDVARARTAAKPPLLDLDGDGREDWLEIGSWVSAHGRVRVSTERGGRVLIEDQDDLEYECDERVFPLGDLDGDGKSELALLHPRSDRSAYDFEFWDAVLGAKSWISIVSGSRL